METGIKSCVTMTFTLILLLVLVIVSPEELALSQAKEECRPQYEQCIDSCGKQYNSCHADAAGDIDGMARCDNQYTACNEKCFQDFCRQEKGERSNQ